MLCEVVAGCCAFRLTGLDVLGSVVQICSDLGVPDCKCRFGEIIPSAVFTGSEQLTMAARFSVHVGRFLAIYSNLFKFIQ